MMNILNTFVLSASRKPAKGLFGSFLRNNVTCIRTLQTTKKPIKSLLLCRKYNQNILRNNVRFESEKPKDRFIPKDPFANKNLWKPVMKLLAIGAIATAYILYLKNEKKKTIEKERQKAVGKAAIGGKFELVDQNNKVRKSDDFLGQWLMIYFGFTHCPDICPDEMEKIAQVVETIEKDKSIPNLTPIFITVDPERDTPSVVGKYVKEFSDKFIGLTGTQEQIAAVCKAYRVYFSPGPKDKDSDYIIDHSIIMYLVNPKGEFLDYYGKNASADQIVDGFKFNYMNYVYVNEPSFFDRLFK